jgi:hypothetical protein
LRRPASSARAPNPASIIAQVEAGEGRLIVVTRKTPFGPPTWFYASRAEGLEIMIRPALAAFEAARRHSPSSPFVLSAQTALEQAIDDASERDRAAIADR